MKQRGVLYPLKFEKACSRKDLRAFMLLYRFMKSGQILPIPNFIYFTSPSVFCPFALMNYYSRYPLDPQVVFRKDMRESSILLMVHINFRNIFFVFLTDF